MSTLVVPNASENHLNDMLVAGASTTLRVRLFQSNTTPSQSTVIGDLTEATFSGYAAVTPSFGASATASNKGTITDSAARDFTHNGGGTSNTIYGYYVTYESGGSTLLWAERFDIAQTLANNGDKITLTAKFTLNSEN